MFYLLVILILIYLFMIFKYLKNDTNKFNSVFKIFQTILIIFILFYMYQNIDKNILYEESTLNRLIQLIFSDKFIFASKLSLTLFGVFSFPFILIIIKNIFSIFKEMKKNNPKIKEQIYSIIKAIQKLVMVILISIVALILMFNSERETSIFLSIYTLFIVVFHDIQLQLRLFEKNIIENIEKKILKKSKKNK